MKGQREGNGYDTLGGCYVKGQGRYSGGTEPSEGTDELGWVSGRKNWGGRTSLRVARPSTKAKERLNRTTYISRTKVSQKALLRQGKTTGPLPSKRVDRTSSPILLLVLSRSHRVTGKEGSGTESDLGGGWTVSRGEWGVRKRSSYGEGVESW